MQRAVPWVIALHNGSIGCAVAFLPWEALKAHVKNGLRHMWIAMPGSGGVGGSVRRRIQDSIARLNPQSTSMPHYTEK
jgi:hypothetical protein